MAVAGCQAIAVIDFHHLTIARPIAGEGDDAGRHRGYFRAFLARKVQAFVHCGIARKGIRSAPEVRRDPAFLDRPALGVNLLIEFTA